jgi:hypothetical protein
MVAVLWTSMAMTPPKKAAAQFGAAIEAPAFTVSVEYCGTLMTCAFPAAV